MNSHMSRFSFMLDICISSWRLNEKVRIDLYFPPVQQCHTYLLTYLLTCYPAGYPGNELPDNGSPNSETIRWNVCRLLMVVILWSILYFVMDDKESGFRISVRQCFVVCRYLAVSLFFLKCLMIVVECHLPVVLHSTWRDSSVQRLEKSLPTNRW